MNSANYLRNNNHNHDGKDSQKCNNLNSSLFWFSPSNIKHRKIQGDKIISHVLSQASAAV